MEFADEIGALAYEPGEDEAGDGDGPQSDDGEFEEFDDEFA